MRPAELQRTSEGGLMTAHKISYPRGISSGKSQYKPRIFESRHTFCMLGSRTASRHRIGDSSPRNGR